MFCEHLLNKHSEKQCKAFKKGFDRVVDTKLIEVHIRISRCLRLRSWKLLSVVNK